MVHQVAPIHCWSAAMLRPKLVFVPSQLLRPRWLCLASVSALCVKRQVSPKTVSSTSRPVIAPPRTRGAHPGVLHGNRHGVPKPSHPHVGGSAPSTTTPTPPHQTTTHNSSGNTPGEVVTAPHEPIAIVIPHPIGGMHPSPPPI
jgi:hypothetical protein